MAGRNGKNGKNGTSQKNGKKLQDAKSLIKDTERKILKQQRLHQIWRMKLENPSITKFESVQIVMKKYGVKERCAYRYLEEVDRMFEIVSDYNLIKERNELILRIKHLYSLALQKNQLNICASCNKQLIEIFGLKTLRILEETKVVTEEKTTQEVNINIDVKQQEVEDAEVLQILTETGYFEQISEEVSESSDSTSE